MPLNKYSVLQIYILELFPFWWFSLPIKYIKVGSEFNNLFFYAEQKHLQSTLDSVLKSNFLPKLIIIWNISLGVFSVLLVLKVESVFPDSTSWFLVFAPLFSSDGINAYFCIIVFIRQYLYQEFSNAPLRTLWSLLVIGSKHFTYFFITSAPVI